MVQENTKTFNRNIHPHRRYNPLLGEWVLVSPQRGNRPWQGQQETAAPAGLPGYDAACYLCPGNIRTSGSRNPDYTHAFVFDNDFPALLSEEVAYAEKPNPLLICLPERGINRVVCFSPVHHLTLPEMETEAIEKIIEVWQHEYIALGSKDFINYIQIFENKGSVMGCSNPHPHGQIWAQHSLPVQIEKTQFHLLQYYKEHGRSILTDYLASEAAQQERVVLENDHFVVLVPFWAIWPFETLIISKRHFGSIVDMTPYETRGFAEILKLLTIKYDNLFNISFPYSSGIHQTPTDGKDHPEWHFHMHFYPPLLRSAHVKKFMVGYEMLAESQRDVTPESSASILRALPDIHYKEMIPDNQV